MPVYRQNPANSCGTASPDRRRKRNYAFDAIELRPSTPRPWNAYLIWRDQPGWRPTRLAAAAGRMKLWRSGGLPLVAMVEPADTGRATIRPELAGFDGTCLGRVLAEREVGSRALVVRDVGSKHPPEMSLIEDDDVVQTFAT